LINIVKSRDIVFIRNLCSMMITSASVACWTWSLSLSFRIGNDHENTLQGKEKKGEAAPELPRAREEREYEEPASIQVSIFRYYNLHAMVHNAALCTVGCTSGLHAFLPAFLRICIDVACTNCNVSVQIFITLWCLVKCWPYPSCGACSSPLLTCNIAVYVSDWAMTMRYIAGQEEE